MIRFLLDENFNRKIVRGLRARQPDVDTIRVQDTELSGANDPTVLEWAAKEGRILLTHDLDTMTKYANERIAQGLPVAGVIFVRDTIPVAKVIDDLLAILGASEASEWENPTDFLPLYALIPSALTLTQIPVQSLAMQASLSCVVFRAHRGI